MSRYDLTALASALHLYSNYLWDILYTLTLVVDHSVNAKLHQLGYLSAILLSHALYEFPNLKDF